jgi:hypothetical protein
VCDSAGADARLATPTSTVRKPVIDRLAVADPARPDTHRPQPDADARTMTVV